MFDSSAGIIPLPQGTLHWIFWHNNQTVSTAKSADWLTSEETSYWHSLKTDKRRADWLLGRRAAKQLVTRLVRVGNERDFAPNEISILPHADGWPVVTFPHHHDPPVITLSISHSHNRAFCAATLGANQVLGADIEYIEPRSAAFPDEYFTTLEQQFLSAAPAGQYTILSNAIWSAKESVFKAIRRGLAEDTRLVSCLPHPLMAGSPEWLPLRIVWSGERSDRPLPELKGWWRVMDGMVATLAFAAVTG